MFRWTMAAAFAVLLASCATGTAKHNGSAPTGLQVDLTYETLDNGLKVVLAPDNTAPTVTIGWYVDVGYRTEPRDRSGFAHLFEHLMFEETENLENGEFDRIIEGAGGVNNGYTTQDHTGYYAVVPSHLLETMLWVEADRIARLTVNDEIVENQKSVVDNELKVRNVNQPYGGYAWLTDWVAETANENPFNQRDIDDELADVAAAKTAWARAFFDRYYAPNNIALVIAGDFELEQARDWVKRYLGPIPARAEVVHPDTSEPPQTEERRATRRDPLAPRPAIAIAYKTPPRGTRERKAFGFIDQILATGGGSRLHGALVMDEGYSSGLYNLFGWGNVYDEIGPALWTIGLIHDAEHDPEDILATFDDVIAEFIAAPPNGDEMKQARVQLRSNLYDLADSPTRAEIAGALGVFALYDDDPARINRLEAERARISPEFIRETAAKWLIPQNRTVLIIEPPQTGEVEQ